jgi:hypothetical protein
MIQMLQRLSSLILVATAATPAVAQYRGMPAGWPAATYTPATTAGYAPAPAGQAYYAARPVYGAAPYAGQYAGYAYAGNQYANSQYAPATVAYANPAYRAGYNTTLPATGQAATAAYRPVQYVAAAPQSGGTTAYYAPQAYAGQAPTVAYYAPTTAQYAPGSAYTVTPAGGSSAGAEAYAGYGQPAPVNYTPPRFVYRTVNAQVPVYAWRPVTVYQPVTGQAVTCLQPAAPATQCQTQRRRWFSHSWFSHSWFGGSRSSCGAAPAPAPTTAMCTTNYCGSTCGTTPYYNTQPGVILPTAPAPGTTIISPITPGATLPTTGTPTTIIPGPSVPTGPTIPSPPSRFPNSGTVIPTNPADSRPSLSPPPTGSSFPTNPGLPPGSTVTPITPGTGSGSFGTGGGTGSFGTGTNYPPESDPYTPSSSSRPAVRQPATESDRATSASPTAIEGPELHPQVRANPDPDAVAPPQPVNRAPQLLDPRDKTAQLDARRWGVVPAVWPTRPAPVQTASLSESPYHSAPGQTSLEQASTSRAIQERSLRTSEAAREPSAAAYDASGWESAR